MSMSEDNSYQGQPLTDNLGTARELRQQGLIDDLKFTVLDKEEIMFVMYATIRMKKSTTWELILDSFIRSKIAIDGRGRRDIIRGESVRKGIGASVNEEIQRPNLLARYTYDREGEEEYQKKKKELELDGQP